MNNFIKYKSERNVVTSDFAAQFSSSRAKQMQTAHLLAV